MRRVLILGLGNTVLTDDALGIHAVRLIAEQANAEGIETAEAEVAGFALLDLLDGFDSVVIIDALNVAGLAPGEIVAFDPREQTPSLHLVSAHQIDVRSALELAAPLGLTLPTQAMVVGVQVGDARTFGEECTPEVALSVSPAAEEALALARQFRDSAC